MKLTPQNVQKVIMDCLFKDGELNKDATEGNTPKGAVIAKSVMVQFGFHPGRLESHRADVRSMLMELTSPFMKTGGGGMTFLNACQTLTGEQWGEHKDIDCLFALGIGLGYVSFPMPRDMWSVLPGGVPYVTIDDTKE